MILLKPGSDPLKNISKTMDMARVWTGGSEHAQQYKIVRIPVGSVGRWHTLVKIARWHHVTTEPTDTGHDCGFLRIYSTFLTVYSISIEK